MGLTVWDETEDYFAHAALQANFNAIDTHDHSTGKGVPIGTGGIAANAITSALIAPGAIQNAQLGPNAVGSSNIQANAVTSAQLASGSVSGSIIPNGAITYAQLNSTILPLGSVMLWWRDSTSSAVPGGGWEIMDGRSWNSIPNSLGLTTGHIPDMRGDFVRGADINGSVAPGIGATGGANSVNLSHHHGVHGHTHNVPSHSHTIPNDGNHRHKWLGLSVYARANAFPANISVKDFDNNWVHNTYHTLYVNGFGDTGVDINQQLDMDTVPAHNHSGATGGSSTLTTDSGAAHDTDDQLGTISTIPSYTSLLFIMRVR